MHNFAQFNQQILCEEAEKYRHIIIVIDLIKMLVYKQSDSTNQSCNHCIKNTSLIKKYEQLIKLYKKKQVRLSTDGSSRISNLKTSCHTIEVSSTEVNCVRLVHVLSDSVRREYAQAWKGLRQGIDSKVSGKLALLRISNLLAKQIKNQAFGLIKNSAVQGNQARLVLKQNKSENSQQKMKVKEINGNSVIQQYIAQAPLRLQQIQKSFIQTLKNISQNTTHPNPGSQLKQRQKMELQIKLKFLALQNQSLRQCLQDFQKRQMKQNEKKRQSLEMLAEQISQKNDQIIHLKTALKKYEQNGDQQNNMLDEDTATLKNQIERLERLRQKLNGDVEKVKEQVQNLEVKLKQSQKVNEQLRFQNNEMRKKCYQAQISSTKSEKLKRQLSSVISKLQRKLKRFITYEKELQLQVSENCSPTNFSTGLAQELKSQFILMYLSNIAEADYALQNTNLFDEQQIQFLAKLKEDWINLNNMQKIEVKGRHEVDFSGIQGRGQMQSIFEALQQSPRQNNDRQGLAMKMLELELEKNKQISKISELKQKFFHIRMIVLNLLKSLQLQASMKSECLDILRVLFDLFQYSEQERDSIFVKKRKIFSFL